MNVNRSSVESPIPLAAQMHQLLTGFEVSQALFVVAELGVATALLDRPRGSRSRGTSRRQRRCS